MAGTFNVAGVAVSGEHFIDGRRVDSEDRFEVRSPLDWTLKLADVARGTPATAEAAVKAALAAFPGWAALGPKGRAIHLNRLADLIDQRKDDIAAVECMDMAMLLESLRARVIPRGALNFRNYADLAASHEERAWSSKGTANRVIRMPAGPAVIITPWNAPFMLST
ncbi:MAG: aldehyde dehydrogenase family protein, partial [Steroidobacteraceae bacterium]